MTGSEPLFITVGGKQKPCRIDHVLYVHPRECQRGIWFNKGVDMGSSGSCNAVQTWKRQGSWLTCNSAELLVTGFRPETWDGYRRVTRGSNIKAWHYMLLWDLTTAVNIRGNRHVKITNRAETDRYVQNFLSGREHRFAVASACRCLCLHTCWIDAFVYCFFLVKSFLLNICRKEKAYG